MSDGYDGWLKDWVAEWRDEVGRAVMFAMTCTHYETNDFGSRAVCDTCFSNTQQIGRIVENFAARAWDEGRAAERRDWELLGDLVTPDEDRQPLPNPYRADWSVAQDQSERPKQEEQA